jgi:hypothetical protein
MKEKKDKYIRLDSGAWKDLKLMSVKLDTNMKALAEKYIREGLKKEEGKNESTDH